MSEHSHAHLRMVPVQLNTDEGAFIGNIRESDLAKIDAAKPGIFVVVYCAIRLDATIEGRYELYGTKAIETSSIDFYQSLQRKERCAVRKRQNVLYLKKGPKDA